MATISPVKWIEEANQEPVARADWTTPEAGRIDAPSVPSLGFHYERTKRILDLLLASVLLVLTAPILLVVAAAVWLESGSPILFRQERIGRNGKPFRCLKFRTMRQDAERILGADPALRELHRKNGFKLPPELDPRVTRLGRFLRATSLDELPQLFNVIGGTMSLVGPRPVVPEELKEYGPHVGAYLAVRPGVTGAWQVSGRSRIGYPERAWIDANYVRTWTLGADLRILVRTIPAVLFRLGAH
jgi:lipopolysaccharide/colanic/teichoic acid biosynthesis glycosyltransferase